MRKFLVFVLVLLVAMAIGVGLGVLLNNRLTGNAPPKAAETVKVLVWLRDLEPGHTVSAATDLGWVDWPRERLSPQFAVASTEQAMNAARLQHNGKTLGTPVAANLPLVPKHVAPAAQAPASAPAVVAAPVTTPEPPPAPASVPPAILSPTLKPPKPITVRAKSLSAEATAARILVEEEARSLGATRWVAYREIAASVTVVVKDTMVEIDADDELRSRLLAEASSQLVAVPLGWAPADKARMTIQGKVYYAAGTGGAAEAGPAAPPAPVEPAAPPPTQPAAQAAAPAPAAPKSAAGILDALISATPTPKTTEPPKMVAPGSASKS